MIKSVEKKVGTRGKESAKSVEKKVRGKESVEKTGDRIREAMKANPKITVDQTAQYMSTLPLHHSQKEEVKTPEYSEFSFFIALTYDFKQELRKQGSNLQVLTPDHLREEFVQEYQNALDKYKTL